MSVLSSVVTQFASETGHLIYSTFFGDVGLALLSDAASLALRPVAVLALKSQLTKGEVLSFGLLGTSALFLLHKYVRENLSKDEVKTWERRAILASFADGVLQLPGILFPHCSLFRAYPISFTGFVPMLVQIPLGIRLFFDGEMIDRKGRPWVRKLSTLREIIRDQCWRKRHLLLSFALGARLTSLNVGDTRASFILHRLGMHLLFFSVAPTYGWSYIEEAASRMGSRLSHDGKIAFSKMKSLVNQFGELPVTQRVVKFMEKRILPVWSVASSLVMPCAMTNLAVSCALWLCHNSFQLTPEYLGRGLCILTTALTTSMLVIHTGLIADRCLTLRVIDPLQYDRARTVLFYTTRILVFPITVVEHFSRRFVQIGPSYVSFPVLIAGNLYFYAGPSFATIRLQMAENVSHAIGLAQQFPLSRAPAASYLTCAVVIAIQMLTIRHVALLLLTVQGVSDPEVQASVGAMQDPRQCGQCGFGPVDYKLWVMEMRSQFTPTTNPFESSGSVTSSKSKAQTMASQCFRNCPRCGTAVNDLYYSWPKWDPQLITEEGQLALRQRTWNEIVWRVRAASKLLVFPFALVRYLQAEKDISSFQGHLEPLVDMIPAIVRGQSLSMPAQLGFPVFCALAYVTFWAVENMQVRVAPVQKVDVRVSKVAVQRSSTMLQRSSTMIQRSSTMAFDEVDSPTRSYNEKILDPFNSFNSVGTTEGVSTHSVLPCGHPYPVHDEDVEHRHLRCPECYEPISFLGTISAFFFA